MFINFCFFNIIEQMLVYNTGLIASRFYEVLGDRDNAGFKTVTISATIIIIGTSLVSDNHVRNIQTAYVQTSGSIFLK